MRTRTLLVLLAGSLPALAQLGVPQAGCFVDGQRHFRPLLGIAGNFLNGDPEPDEVLAAACSGKLAILKKTGTLEVRTRNSVQTWPAPAGLALFGFSAGGSAALVYYPESATWIRVTGDSAVDLPSPPEGEVLAVGNPDQPQAVVRRDGVLWLTGDQPRELPAGVQAPILLLPDGSLLYGRGAALVLVRADGSESAWDLAAPPAAFEWMGRDWIRIALPDGAGYLAFALPEDRDTRLYRLPEDVE